MSVRYAILGLLHYRNMHGYEIKTHIERHFGHMWTINDGQLYPNLKSMEGEGLVSLADVAPSERGGPHKKLYAVTLKGREVFRQWLENSDVSRMVLRDPFIMRFIFFGFGSKEQAAAIIDKQINLYENQYASRINHLERWRRRGQYVRLVAELGVEFNRMYVNWLKRARREILENQEEGVRSELMGLVLPFEEAERAFADQTSD